MFCVAFFLALRERPRSGALENILTNFFLLKVLGWCIPGIPGVGLYAERSSFSLVSGSIFTVFASARFASYFSSFQLLPAN